MTSPAKSELKKIYEEVTNKEGNNVDIERIYIKPHCVIFEINNFSKFVGSDKIHGRAVYGDNATVPYVLIRSYTDLMNKFFNKEIAENELIKLKYHELKHIADYYILDSMEHPLKEFGCSIYGLYLDRLINDFVRDMKSLKLFRDKILEGVGSDERIIRTIQNIYGKDMEMKELVSNYYKPIIDVLSSVDDPDLIKGYSFALPLHAKYHEEYLKHCTSLPDKLIKLFLPFHYSKIYLEDVVNFTKYLPLFKK